MGIGNARIASYARAAPTGTSLPPHGDRKLPEEALFAIRLVIAHYPSWGSETGPDRGTRSSQLAHYPSWGSETSAVCLTTIRTLCSLPLMGIGNN